MRVARPVVSFGVGFLRNAFLCLQGHVKKATAAGGLARGSRPSPALGTADPEAGVSGTLSGLGGRASSWGLENNHICNFFPATLVFTLLNCMSSAFW